MHNVAAVPLPDLKPALLQGRAEPMFDRLAPADLLIEDRYQRGLSPRSIRLIRSIVERWDRLKFKPPVVALTDRGFEVVDGALPRLTHAYAGTVYAAQGHTVAEAVLYVGSATDAREVYVGLTRHRHNATVVVERERLEAAVRVRQSDPRLRPSDAELHERLYVESRRYSEKRNVVDHVEDRAAFIRTGVLPPPHPEPVLDIRRGFEAGRRLRAAMREVAAAPALMLSQVVRLAQAVERGLAKRGYDIAARLRAPTPLRIEEPRRPPAERERPGPDYSR